MKTKILALCGKAGAGKDTILNILAGEHPEYNKIISCTTRPPREGEKNGQDYFFLSNKEYLDKIVSGEMLETSIFNDWCYGTARSQLKDGCINIGIFNPEGLESISEYNDIDVLKILIYASDKTRLIRQLMREESPDVKEIVRRYSTDEEDFNNLSVDFIANNEGTIKLNSLCDEIAREASNWMQK